jgi:hypothetical protein
MTRQNRKCHFWHRICGRTSGHNFLFTGTFNIICVRNTLEYREFWKSLTKSVLKSKIPACSWNIVTTGNERVLYCACARRREGKVRYCVLFSSFRHKERCFRHNFSGFGMDWRRLNSWKALEWRMDDGCNKVSYKGKEKWLHGGIRLCRGIRLLNVAYNACTEFIIRNVDVIK